MVQISAGKDSQVALDEAVRAFEHAGVPDRLVVVHADLGDAEWDDARTLAAELMTALVKGLRESRKITDRPVRILNIMGMRAEESPGRAKKIPYRHDARANNGRRHVDVWLPVHTWTVGQVWDGIKAAGTRPHWAYSEGMSRLSCTFCPLAASADLRCAYRLNPAKGDRYLAVEERIGHRFQARRSLADTLAGGAEEADFKQLALC